MELDIQKLMYFSMRIYCQKIEEENIEMSELLQNAGNLKEIIVTHKSLEHVFAKMSKLQIINSEKK